MRVDRLGHVNIRTPLFEETLLFYEACLGFRRGPAVSGVMRHDNVWLYDEQGQALIHVNRPLPGEKPVPAGQPSRLDHIAFDCSGLASGRARLTANGVVFREQPLPARRLHQLNLLDPNGIKVELTFRTDESES